jgi:hypothetical protein
MQFIVNMNHKAMSRPEVCVRVQIRNVCCSYMNWTCHDWKASDEKVGCGGELLLYQWLCTSVIPVVGNFCYTSVGDLPL